MSEVYNSKCGYNIFCHVRCLQVVRWADWSAGPQEEVQNILNYPSYCHHFLLLVSPNVIWKPLFGGCGAGLPQEAVAMKKENVL